MDKEKVIKMLIDYRSYEFAVRNIESGLGSSGPLMPINMKNHRLMRAGDWDYRRYSLIVKMIKGAVDEVLSDNERIVITRKYLDQNKKSIKEIAHEVHRDRGTVAAWHTSALKQLINALKPLDDEIEHIENFDHMFDRDGQFRYPA
ncbi:sigma-70 family RNA polymerase sigma factor [Paenibacillus sp. Aloe-11]|uniref:sigma-70 family RNA polymerase sigma factor n=1 Tax=Paenibacillus sp. Aloe-11 TaxID=1050222 RepID=UPI00024EFFA2|nr:sigma-70 family RNA polymerase sigma factor [Paenibacillus sp. Aloe-11]EHS59445.1 hypothetical protein WG8_0660 [Paenibacillus sp. Aloe-11]